MAFIYPLDCVCVERNHAIRATHCACKLPILVSSVRNRAKTPYTIEQAR